GLCRSRLVVQERLGHYSPANSSEQYVVSLATGDQSVFEKLGFAYATCYKNL
ncbi:hypothetical protein, partial [Escherichia coli]|uniref:hypothetical protein n=1 Tax=Escherichia coli TaxID=562 RepID=UPI003CC81230